MFSLATVSFLPIDSLEAFQGYRQNLKTNSHVISLLSQTYFLFIHLYDRHMQDTQLVGTLNVYRHRR